MSVLSGHSPFLADVHQRQLKQFQQCLVARERSPLPGNFAQTHVLRIIGIDSVGDAVYSGGYSKTINFIIGTKLIVSCVNGVEFFMSQISQSSFLRFLLVGGSATLFHYTIMAALIYFQNITAGVASATGYTLSIFYNYYANAHFTFGGSHSHARSLPRFFFTALVGLGINQIVLLTGINFSMPIVIAQLIGTATVLVWNYLVNATWTFSRRDLQ